MVEEIDEMISSYVDRLLKLNRFFFIFSLVLLGIILILALNLFSQYSNRTAPFDRINESDIHVYKNKVVINISNVQLINYENTNSMVPTLDYGHTGLRIDVKNESEIHVGDIIGYEIPENLCVISNNTCASNIIVHRVIKIEKDENGTYFVTKGDNNKINDVLLGVGKVRFSQVKGVLIGLIF